MKVRELIEALAEHDPDAEVELLNDDEWGVEYYPLETVEAAGSLVWLKH